MEDEDEFQRQLNAGKKNIRIVSVPNLVHLQMNNYELYIHSKNTYIF